jgi:hypothetical protein
MLTADQLRGRVRVLIDGKEKFFRFDQGALTHLIDKLGIGGLDDLPSSISSLNGETLKMLVWSGLLWAEPKLKLDDVSKWFYPLLPTYQCALEAINLALWGEANPDFGSEEDASDPPIAATNGISSEPETLQ